MGRYALCRGRTAKSALKLGGDGVRLVGDVPADGEDVGLAAYLAVFDILLTRAGGRVDSGLDPLAAGGALEDGFVDGGAPSFRLLGQTTSVQGNFAEDVQDAD